MNSFAIDLTVSAQHARIQKKDGRLLITDLDSTNGTFIDDKRLRPGVVATVPPGSCITFGKSWSSLKFIYFYFYFFHETHIFLC